MPIPQLVVVESSIQYARWLLILFPIRLDQSEIAQAKIKGLSHNNSTPEPPPRPTKDVNLYQNNQVKVIGTKEKVPIEIKSNILKARADEERHSGKCVKVKPSITRISETLIHS